MIAQLESFGMSFTGKDESGERMEVGIYCSVLINLSLIGVLICDIFLC